MMIFGMEMGYTFNAYHRLSNNALFVEEIHDHDNGRDRMTTAPVGTCFKGPFPRGTNNLAWHQRLSKKGQP